MFVIFVASASVVLILMSSSLFTNGIEWIGSKLRLDEGAVGSLLAALGTALPETMVPVVAMTMRKDPEAVGVGVGAILGAPLLLATVGFFLLTICARCLPGRKRSRFLEVPPDVVQRDLTFFLTASAVVLLSGVVPSRSLKLAGAVILLAIYVRFVLVALRSRELRGGMQLRRLYMAYRHRNPPVWVAVAQVVAALALLIYGARGFVAVTERVAHAVHFAPFVVSALLIPLATELPETLNSVVWLRQRKDTLALGNVSGAMVFQTTIVPAVGIFFTPWNLDLTALWTGMLAMLAAGFVLTLHRIRGHVTMVSGAFAGLCYFGLPLWTLWQAGGLQREITVLCMLVALLLLVTYNYGRRPV